MHASREIFLFASATLILSCGKNDDVSHTDFGYNYLPLTVGSWVEYAVDSIVFDDFAETVDTFSFIMRDECVEQFDDLSGRTVYRYELSCLRSDTGQFEFVKTYALLRQGQRIEKYDDNLRTVPLVFPPRLGQTWNPNAFNHLKAQDYEYVEVDQETSIAAMTFDSALRVIQVNDTGNFVFKRFAEERYARNTGLIYREYYEIQTQFNIDSGLHWIQRIRDAYVLMP